MDEALPADRGDGQPPAEQLRDLVETIVDGLGIDAAVDLDEDEETLTATIEGEELGIVIGRHGQTIDAIQHLAQRVVLRDRSVHKAIVVDAAGYRDRRRATLNAQADAAAEEAVRHGRPVSLDAMNPGERRIVHERLRDRLDVETYSEGSEPDRHLVVAPVIER
ncbi:MAG: KH domain-containing protein [Actinobacteria bacterium]|nr:MAG: KH domain-containing protein [Actinomycetota bacterium]